jgi:phosphoribosylformylglycinamidine synthase
VDGFRKNAEEQLRGRVHDQVVKCLFAEELGAVLQVKAAHRAQVMDALRGAGLGEVSHIVGTLNDRDEIRFTRSAKALFAEKRVDLQRAWSETTYLMQKLRDNPECAQEEYDRILDVADPGLSVQLTFDPKEVFVNTGASPRVAILREQGVNGQVEMGAAFTRAGFEAVDLHMSDLISGRVSLSSFKGYAACGGFSYGDVLGGGQGWAKSILFNARARKEFEAFFARSDTFALGICNGCQMMSALKELVPGARHWPSFERNRSEQFEARMVMVEIVESPSIVFRGMAGSRIPGVTAHGEGRAQFASESDRKNAIVAARFVDNRGVVTEIYPLNPNGSPEGITGLTTTDGRFTILMEHPERVFRTVQMSWAPDGSGEDSPWMRLFRNARSWVA